MSGKVCKCGHVLSDNVYPNDLVWDIYDKSEFDYWIGDEYFELTQEKEDFDYLWLCPNCKRCHVWLYSNREHCEFRIYEYKDTEENETININDLKEIYVISANDEESFKQNITVKEIMYLHLHDHRYFVTDDEKIVYLYNVKTEQLDGKYIIKYSDNSEYDQRIENKTINIVKIYEGIEKYFDDNGNEIDSIDEKNDNLPDNVLWMNIDDTNFELGIFDYVRGENNDDNWANLIVKVKNKNFNYLKNAELMTSAEVERLLNGLQRLLNDELKEKEGIGFYEPDLEFDLYPKMNLWNTGKYAYIKEGYEIQDIYVEFTINLTDREGTYTGQKYVMIFDREEIEKIVEYMKKVMCV